MAGRDPKNDPAVKDVLRVGSEIRRVVRLGKVGRTNMVYFRSPSGGGSCSRRDWKGWAKEAVVLKGG